MMNAATLRRWAIVSSALAPLTAQAQEAPPAAPAEAQAQAAGDIIVTAQRREQRLQDVPVAVTAFGADQLKSNNIESVQDIATRTPGLSIGQVDPINQNFSMRGIGSASGISQNAGGDASVVVFVDGVYAGRGGIPDLDSLDLERVEVLRGPQGTLFGKNAIGGLVQFVSRRPSADPSFHIEGGYGNYNRYSILAYGNTPITDTTFLSVGFSHKQRDGFEYNETTGNRVNNENLTTGRVALRFVPTDALDIVLRADWADQNQLGNPRHNNCNTAFAGGVHCAGINPDPRTVNAYTDGYIKRFIQTYSAEINYDTPLGKLTSVTAVRKVDFRFLTPFFSNPVNPPNQIESTDFGHEWDNQLSQELRLAFNAFGNKLHGQTGIYYLREHNNRIEGQIQDFATPAISGTAIYPQYARARSFALFGQVDYDILPTLTATVGARMTWEHKEGEFAGYKVSGPGLPPPLGSLAGYDVHGAKSWKAFTPRFALNWKVTPDVMLYGSVARGYKSGGFQGLSGTAAGAATPYDPEFAWGYEAGAKTQWFDRKLTFNLALFRTDYKDLQVSQLIPLCCVVVSNAAKARLQGVEVEAVARPFAGFQLDGSYSYLDAKFTAYSIPGQNYTGNQLPRSPRNKFNVGAQYELPVGDWSAKARVDYAWVGDAYFEASNIPQQLWPAHENLDARVSLRAPGKAWELSVWGKNLTDALVPTYVTYFGPYQQTLVPYAPPRTYGMTLAFDM
ncbi:TonB-dependent receptor [Sphingomonas lycopersici]|uniref:TonB-dependent receptor n=1 Tax=Sphingomonas lycopersici TaxID=2951807 RepID=A0AA41ZC70_9SPHN|nr:TonB-dependent receptor [Sphingomonas lycopersici]MCW6537772.1 TonB-dependent receptor [Sphingomonas lycopersici]